MIKLGHLDINIVTHCNNRCVACSHVSPFTSKYEMTPETLLRDLDALSKVVHFHQVQIVGGEPLLHPRIVEMMEICEMSGLGNDVSVTTNGRLLPKMGDDFWNALQVLQLSIYGNLDPDVLPLAKAKANSHDFALFTTVFKEFYRQFKPVKDDGKASFYNCIWKNDCYTCHEGHFYRCPQSAFFYKVDSTLKEFEDGLPLDGITEEKLSQFIKSPVPLKACSLCSGGHSHAVPWKESKNRAEWLMESTI